MPAQDLLPFLETGVSWWDDLPPGLKVWGRNWHFVLMVAMFLLWCFSDLGFIWRRMQREERYQRYRRNVDQSKQAATTISPERGAYDVYLVFPRGSVTPAMEAMQRVAHVLLDASSDELSSPQTWSFKMGMHHGRPVVHLPIKLAWEFCILFLCAATESDRRVLPLLIGLSTELGEEEEFSVDLAMQLPTIESDVVRGGCADGTAFRVPLPEADAPHWQSWWDPHVYRELEYILGGFRPWLQELESAPTEAFEIALPSFAPLSE